MCKERKELPICKKCPIDEQTCSVLSQEGCTGCVCVDCTPEKPLCTEEGFKGEP